MADGRNFTGMSVYNTDNPKQFRYFRKPGSLCTKRFLRLKKERRWQNYAQIEVWQGGNIEDAMGWYYGPMMGNGIGPFNGAWIFGI